MNYKDALKEGLYEFQIARDWYREMTTTPLNGSSTVLGMHADLIELYIRTTALILQPIAPHFSEHLWGGILGEKSSIQTALWKDIPLANASEEDLKREAGAVEAGAYMRATVKAVRDAEITLAKKSKKGAAAAGGAPAGRKAVRLIVATSFPAWQKETVAIVQASLSAGDEPTVDDAAVKKGLVAKKMVGDKRVMPFVQVLKVRSVFIVNRSLCFVRCRFLPLRGLRGALFSFHAVFLAFRSSGLLFGDHKARSCMRAGPLFGPAFSPCAPGCSDTRHQGQGSSRLTDNGEQETGNAFIGSYERSETLSLSLTRTRMPLISVWKPLPPRLLASERDASAVQISGDGWMEGLDPLHSGTMCVCVRGWFLSLSLSCPVSCIVPSCHLA